MSGDGLRVLILSFYYSPDLSAGSFRATALVKALKKKLPKNSHIDVVTTSPNRYGTFSVNASEIEDTSGLHVRRITLPTHKNGMIDQSKAFLSYWRQVIRYVESRDYDLVLGTSSRLMTAILAARVAKNKNAILYLDIRDIFVDTIKDVLPKILALVVKPVFSRLEAWAIQRANKVNLVSEGFSDYFKMRYPCQRYSFFTNGIDAEFLETPMNFSLNGMEKSGRLTVLYAGNLGAGQGLESILPGIAKEMRGRAVFRVIGDGGRKDALGSELALAEIDNVVLLSPMKRDKLVEEYRNADVLFLHLNDYDAFKKVLPSKIFEYAATGKPVWAGVAGFAAKFIEREVSNASVFAPGDVAGAIRAFEKLALHQVTRSDFLEKFSRATIMDAMAIDIIEVAESHN